MTKLIKILLALRKGLTNNLNIRNALKGMLYSIDDMRRVRSSETRIAPNKETTMEISAVKLRNSYQINYVDTNNLFVNQNAFCVVETEHGVDIGNVFKCRQGASADARPR